MCSFNGGWRRKCSSNEFFLAFKLSIDDAALGPFPEKFFTEILLSSLTLSLGLDAYLRSIAARLAALLKDGCLDNLDGLLDLQRKICKFMKIHKIGKKIRKFEKFTKIHSLENW